MENLRNLFRKPELHAFICCLALVLFTWPLMTIVEEKRDGSIFVYLFLAWGFIIGLLMLIAASHRRKRAESTGKKRREG